MTRPKGIEANIKKNPKTGLLTITVTDRTNGKVLLSSTSQQYSRRIDAERILERLAVESGRMLDDYLARKKKEKTHV